MTLMSFWLYLSLYKPGSVRGLIFCHYKQFKAGVQLLVVKRFVLISDLNIILHDWSHFTVVHIAAFTEIA